jgi:hypothetical protein
MAPSLNSHKHCSAEQRQLKQVPKAPTETQETMITSNEGKIQSPEQSLGNKCNTITMGAVATSAFIPQPTQVQDALSQVAIAIVNILLTRHSAVLCLVSQKSVTKKTNLACSHEQPAARVDMTQ